MINKHTTIATQSGRRYTYYAGKTWRVEPLNTYTGETLSLRSLTVQGAGTVAPLHECRIVSQKDADAADTFSIGSAWPPKGGSTRAPSRTDRDLYHKTFALLMLIALTLPALGWEPAEAPEHYARALTAAVILAEAKGESPQGRQAVYEVIWTRVSETESNYIKVLTKRKQFSCLNGVEPNDLIAKERKHPLWWSVYGGLLKFPPLTTWTVPKGLPKTNRYRANHYYAHRTVKPYWSNGNGKVIGNHTFERH